MPPVSWAAFKTASVSSGFTVGMEITRALMPGGDVVQALGATAATYLRETLSSGDIVGISACSSTLLATTDAMRPKTGLVVNVVTQLVGGNGDPRGATRLITRFANLTGARAALLQSQRSSRTTWYDVPCSPIRPLPVCCRSGTGFRFH
jgi:hypothetical protein